MDHFHYQHNEFYAESVPLSRIAQEVGTPCYVYSRAAITQSWRAFDEAFGTMPHGICYAVKANSNLAVLNILARLGSWFDIVSGGELARVIAAGALAERVVFSGVGKTKEEIEYALSQGIHCFNVESEAELFLINEIAQQKNLAAPISLRINPDVDAKTHPYIATGLKENKFGVTQGQAIHLFNKARHLSGLKIKGITCHIGSQITELAPFLDAFDQVLQIIDDLARTGILLEHVDMGGGLGVRYHQETPPSISQLVNALQQRLGTRPLTLMLEPGRAIVANAGILLTRVLYLKETEHRHFAIVDGAMNDLIRPALYDAWQDVVPAIRHPDLPSTLYDIVGPICETGDFLAKDRALSLLPNDLVVILSAGAYGFVMSSQYNSRPRAPEVMIDGDQLYIVRPREHVKELFASESLLP